jgi:uncharacterized protein DUF1176
LIRRPSRALFAATVAAVLCPAGAWAEPLPGLKTPADRAAWRSLLHWRSSCERRWRQGGMTTIAGIETWRTTGGDHIVSVDCFLGAYQPGSMVYHVSANGKASGPFRFRIYEDPGNAVPKPRSETMVVGLVTFHPASGRLTVHKKSRGLGDCGIYSVFRLRGGAFVPVEARAKTKCDGKPPYEPTRWPKLPTPR